MKKRTIILIMLFISMKGFAQFATFDPIMPNTPASGSTTSNDEGEIARTTGYILDNSGYVIRKLHLKVSVETTSFGESVRIVSFYNVNKGFGAGWENVSVPAQAVGGQTPITEQQKVAYSNFNYWAFWGTDQIWFSI